MGKPQAPIPRRTQSWNTPTPVIAATCGRCPPVGDAIDSLAEALLRRRPATAEEVQGFRPFRTPQVGHAGLGLSLREQIVWTEELIVEAHDGRRTRGRRRGRPRQVGLPLPRTPVAAGMSRTKRSASLQPPSAMGGTRQPSATPRAPAPAPATATAKRRARRRGSHPPLPARRRTASPVAEPTPGRAAPARAKAASTPASAPALAASSGAAGRSAMRPGLPGCAPTASATPSPHGRSPTTGAKSMSHGSAGTACPTWCAAIPPPAAAPRWPGATSPSPWRTECSPDR